MRELAVGVSIMMLLLLVAAPAADQDRPIVAVFDVDAQGVYLASPTWERLNNYLASLLTEHGFQVVPRSQLKERLKERLKEKKKESYLKCFEEACQIEIGKDLAAQKSLATQVIQLGGKCKVALTIYDLKKETSEKGKTVSGGCDEDQIIESLENAVDQLVGGGTVQPPVPAPQPAPPAGKAGLTWIKSLPAGIEFTRSEVTVAQYRACVEAGKCSAPNSREKHPHCNWGYLDRDNHPVNCVDWIQATAFCGWVEGRLPTEEEWYAEASNKGTRQYPWGDQEVTCDYAVMDQGGNGCGRFISWPVCSKERGNSVSGLCDMSGNMWEWTSTSEGSNRILRGGSWTNTNAAALRASYRNVDLPARLDPNLGFRCGRTSR